MISRSYSEPAKSPTSHSHLPSFTRITKARTSANEHAADRLPSKYNFSLFGSMDSSQTSPENGDEKAAEIAQNGQNPGENPPPPRSGIAPESGLRKRRNVARRRSSSLTRRRELTPLRDPAGAERSSEDDVDEEEDVAPKRRPKTPERRRRTLKRMLDSVNSAKEKKNEMNGVEIYKEEEIDQNEESPEKITEIANNINDVKKESTPIQLPEDALEKSEFKKEELISKDPPEVSPEESTTTKIENLVNLSQTEFISMLDKAKKTIKSSRDKYNKLRNNQKRSQSAPRELTDEQLLESFKKAQKQSAERESVRTRANSSRKYSTDSTKSTSSTDNKIPIKPNRRQIVKITKSPPPPIKRKPLTKQYSSNKIVEILDPKTSKVIRTKQIIDITMEWKDIVTIYKHFKLREIFSEYKKFQFDMMEEYRKIVTLRRKCLCELVVMMVICGLGGVLFKFVEGAFENFYKCGVKRVKRDFVDLLWIKSHNLREEDWKSLARNRLRVFEEELHTAHEAGVHTYTGQRSWSFLNGVVYSLTIVSTIGKIFSDDDVIIACEFVNSNFGVVFSSLFINLPSLLYSLLFLIFFL